MTHLPFRAWCLSCVEGKARDRPHRRQDVEEKSLAEVVFDYGFLGAQGEEETVAIQVARDSRTKMLFAHVVPRKGLTHEHGAEDMIKDIKKLGYLEVILKCDGEPALKSVQEEGGRNPPYWRTLQWETAVRMEALRGQSRQLESKFVYSGEAWNVV